MSRSLKQLLCSILNTILDSLDAPERVDQIAYQQAVEDRLREDERGRMEKYLRSKHLLF